MKPPSTVKIGPYTYRVKVSEKKINRIGHEDGAHYHGATEHSPQRIVIRSGEGPDTEADTLLHEVLHAVLHVNAMSFDMVDPDQEERLIRRLTPAILALLRDNPYMVEYLTS